MVSGKLLVQASQTYNVNIEAAKSYMKASMFEKAATEFFAAHLSAKYITENEHSEKEQEAWSLRASEAMDAYNALSYTQVIYDHWKVEIVRHR